MHENAQEVFMIRVNNQANEPVVDLPDGVEGFCVVLSAWVDRRGDSLGLGDLA